MRKVLFISYFFPPLPSQRCVKFVKYLPKYGWSPSVLAPERSKYPRSDATLLREVPPACEVIRVPSSEHVPGPMVQAADFASGWFPEAVKHGIRMIEEQKIDAIYSTASPNLSHLVALSLKRTTGTPWAADFRDEWTANPYIQGKYPPAAMEYNRKLEFEALREADAVIGISGKMSDALFRLSGLQDSSKFHTIHEGFDPVDFGHLPPPQRAGKFRAAYMGAMYGLRKSLLDTFLAHLIKAAKTGGFPANELELHMIGDPLALPLGDRVVPVKNYGHLPHHAALDRASAADVLLLFIDPKEGLQTVPSKLFEYFKLQRPILALVPERSEVAELIRRTRTGEVVDSGNPAQAVQVLRRRISEWKAKAAAPWSPDGNEIEQFNRVQLTGKLAGVLNRITKP